MSRTMIDWSDGSYERTAPILASVATRALDALDVTPGMRLLDLGCGTGNVAIEAARRGAQVTAVDPAARLVDVTLERAREAALGIDVLIGDAGAIPVAASSFDAVASVFAVIFAPDAYRAAGEIMRVLRPGGRAVITAWRSHGAIFEAGAVLRSAVPAPPAGASVRPPPPDWGDSDFVRSLFEAHGAAVHEDESTLSFTAESPDAWFDEQEAHHPVWRGVRAMCDPARWSVVRARSIAVLRANNEDPKAFRATSAYSIVRVTRARS